MGVLAKNCGQADLLTAVRLCDIKAATVESACRQLSTSSIMAGGRGVRPSTTAAKLIVD